jgi:hypothetical protein
MEGMMSELVRQWPRELERVLAELRPISGRTGCYAAEVDLSEEEVRALNLFEGSARHVHVCFKDPMTAEECFAYLNHPVAVGAPKRGYAARVRVSLTDVQPHYH